MSGPQAVIPFADNDPGLGEIGRELEQALLLVRVSTMKMLRLQLAIERRDRAVALETVDDLIELDAWMAVTANRAADQGIMQAIALEVEDQRSALLHERFGLAAGLVKRAEEPSVRPWADVAEDEDETDEAYVLGPAERIQSEDPAARGSHWWTGLAITLLVVAIAVAAVAFTLPDAFLTQWLGLGG